MRIYVAWCDPLVYVTLGLGWTTYFGIFCFFHVSVSWCFISVFCTFVFKCLLFSFMLFMYIWTYSKNGLQYRKGKRVKECYFIMFHGMHTKFIPGHFDDVMLVSVNKAGVYIKIKLANNCFTMHMVVDIMDMKILVNFALTGWTLFIVIKEQKKRRKKKTFTTFPHTLTSRYQRDITKWNGKIRCSLVWCLYPSISFLQNQQSPEC